MRSFTRRLFMAGALALTVSMAPAAYAEDQILASVPGLTFPFFVHMMNAFKAEGAKQGVGVIESDVQVSSPKQTADVEAAITQGVKGIVISPNEVDAMAPALWAGGEEQRMGRLPQRAVAESDAMQPVDDEHCALGLGGEQLQSANGRAIGKVGRTCR